MILFIIFPSELFSQDQFKGLDSVQVVVNKPLAIVTHNYMATNPNDMIIRESLAVEEAIEEIEFKLNMAQIGHNNTGGYAILIFNAEINMISKDILFYTTTL